MTARKSTHFSLHSFAGDVLAAIAEPGGSAIGNAGLIDLGGQVIVFDTFLTPQAAIDLRRASEELLGQAPNVVVNSHYHNDHIWGNQVFAADAHIVSTVPTRQLIATAGREEFDWYSANAAGQLHSLRQEYANSDDQEQRAELAYWIAYYGGLVDAFPNLTVCMPDASFEGQLVFYGSKRRAELLAFEDAHTGSDVALYLPDDGVIFTSDLLFVGCHPYLADGDPLRLPAVLRELLQLDATRFVPGHGPVGAREDLVLMMEYVERCRELALDLLKAGDVSEDRIAGLEIPRHYKDWEFPRFFRSNVRDLCRRLSQAGDH